MAWILVTGGAKRLGSDICLRLAQEGHAVVVHFKNSAKEAHEIAEQCRRFGCEAATIQGDFSTAESTKDFLSRYLERFPETKGIINNVGNYLVKSALETTMDEWQSLFQINLDAPFCLIKACMPSLIRLRGHIVNIGIAGIQNGRGSVHSSCYQMTKMGLWMLTKSLAKELAPQNVKVNMVSPGYLEGSMEVPKDFDQIPMGRLGTGDEVAGVVAFLLRPESSYITGQNIDVAGGVNL